MQPYLAALASAHIHQQPVPHFARAQDYMALLDPEYAPPTRKRRVVVVEPGNDDEWADPDPVAPIPKRRPRAKRASKPQMKRQSNPWEDKDDCLARSSEHGRGPVWMEWIVVIQLRFQFKFAIQIRFLFRFVIFSQ